MSIRMLKCMCAAALAIGGGSAFAQSAGGDVGQDPTMQQPGGGSQTPDQTGTQGQMGTQGQTGQQGQLGQQGQMQGQQIRLSSLDKNEIKQVQQALQKQGVYQGPIDGVAGPETYAAIGAFQQKQGGRVSGHLDQQTSQALGVSFGEIQPVRGGGEEEQQMDQQQQQQQQPQQQPGGDMNQGGGMEQPPSGGSTGGGSTGGGDSGGGSSTGGGGY
jgi:peptidoglycan hydrolase-like protein with peptidoglycan-binding domain